MAKAATWHFAHKIGDLIRVANRISLSSMEQVGDLGIIIGSPNENRTAGILFVEVYIFRTGRTRWFSPREINIISNIEE